MYLPYVHGKQEELLALVRLSPSLGDLVVPIIKPVNVHPANTSARLETIGRSARYALITNSDKGRDRRPPTYQDVRQLIQSAPFAANATCIFPAFELRANTRIAELEQFVRDFEDRRCLIIHKGHTFDVGELSRAMAFREAPVQVFVEPSASPEEFPGLPSAANVVVRNGFQACERNSDYPARSAFDSLVHQYRQRNLQGFGDFSMIGDVYSDSGGRAKAVALHLTEDLGRTLAMNHFVSTSVGADTATLYFEALDRLIGYAATKAPDFQGTLGVRNYRDSYNRRHFPNLGPAKRWSTMHHIETIQKILASQGARAAF